MPKSTPARKKAVRALVLKRDGNKCQRCGVDVTYRLASIQHRRPRGVGGSALVDVASNLVLVCGSATTPGSCHNWMEHEDRTTANYEGWLIAKLSQVHPSNVPLLTIHGWVLLTDDGDRIPYISGVA